MPKFKFEKFKFEEIIKDYASIKETTIPEAVRANARLLCVELARRTQPFGTKAADGEERVRRDIGKVIKTNETLEQMAQRVDKIRIRERLNTLIERNRLDVVERVMRNIGFLQKWSDMESAASFRDIHKRNRNSTTGRTFRRADKLYIANKPALDTYTDEIARRVGLSKAGWAECANEIGGTRGIPGFVTRNMGKGNGSVRNSLADKDNPHVVLTNSTPWISRICPPTEVLNALSITKTKAKRMLETILNKRMKMIPAEA